MKMTLEERMLNILRSNHIPTAKGQYKAALNRLVSKGKATYGKSGWKLVTTFH